MKIEASTPADVVWVASHLRPADAREFLATSHAEGEADLPDELVQRFSHLKGFTAWSGVPVAYGATIFARPNVATLLFFATPSFPSIALPLTRFIRRRLFPALRASGVHRIECVSIEGHVAAHRWIEILGLSHEADLPRYGRDGETFKQFAWVAP
jgi:hypothetical protein